MKRELFLNGRFGDMVAAKRFSLNETRKPFTLRDAAKAMAVSAPTVFRLEMGHRPDVTCFFKACKWLGVSMDSVLEGWNPE